MLDEADRCSTDAGLGAFLKSVSERLSWENCNSVCFGLAGLPTLLQKLRESHESSPRLFQTMLLSSLEIEERERVVYLGLDAANVKNSTPTQIEKEAVSFLAELSEGYPHFLQQFAYSAFEADTDNLIDETDVASGAFEEGGAMTQLGDKFFSEMYHLRVMSEDYRRVLDAMAEAGDQWLTRKLIIDRSGLSESTVNNALQALKSKAVIMQDDSRRGFYRLPTRSFAVWINAYKTGRTTARQ